MLKFLTIVPSARRMVGMATSVLLLASLAVQPVAASEGPYFLRNLSAQTFVTVGNRVFFTADDFGGLGRELYVSDGTSDGTYMVKDIWPGSHSGLAFSSGGGNPNLLTALGDRLFFIARDGVNGADLYVTDGTSIGTTRLAHRRPCDPQSDKLVAVGSRLVFAAKNASGLCNLYVTDGTVAGTVPVASNIPAFNLPIAFRDRVFFVSYDGSEGNGTLWNTVAVASGGANIVRTFPRLIRELTVSNDRMFMTVGELGYGAKLWKSDGTSAGTHKVRNAPSNPYFLTDLNGVLVFGAYEYDFETAAWDKTMWRSNGRASGTRVIKDFGTDPYAGIPSSGIDVAGDRAYFNAGEDLPGYGYWTSDGTRKGTYFLAKISIFWAAGLGDQLYGGGCYRDETATPVGCGYGYLFFTSDGTVAGTHEIAGAPDVSDVGVAGGTVFLNVHGDLWAYVP
jgi:ELWxxDGT repeat protein